MDDIFAEHQCVHRLCPEHACCLDGLWWSDEEYGPSVYKLWHEYVAKLQAWSRYQDEVAVALGHMLRVSDLSLEQIDAENRDEQV